MEGNSETTASSSPMLELVQEPELKKIKMSSTTDDDDHHDNADTGETKKQRYKRRKIAIFFAYCGVGYQGMQKNPGAKTIESDLEEALYLAGAVPEQDRGNSKRYDWARSARTDKGVSAVGQVVSGRFYIDPPGFVDRLNSNLSPQIRIFGYKRVTASFNAKKFCDRRKYVYLLPVFALDPNAHRDRESVLASLGSENELVKCLECSERGRKVEGLMGTRHWESEASNTASDISSNVDNTISTSELKEEGKELSENAKDSREPEMVKKESDNGIAKPETRFSYGEEERDRFNKILNFFVGTHNFHNFTTRTKAEDPAAQRFIVSFDAKTTIIVDGIELIKCVVVGQSFMLHQIRKMMGLAVAVMRNCTSESLIEKALQKDININVPTAPEVGLFLEECLFSSYNKKWKDTHEEVSMKAYEEQAEEFKMKQIYSHIASTEQRDGVVGLWLHSLNHRNYPDLLLKDSIEGEEKMEGETSFSPAVAVPSFTGLKAAGAGKVAAVVKVSPFPTPRFRVNASLKEVGVAVAAAAVSAVVASNALAATILLGSDTGELVFVPSNLTVASGEKIVFKNNAGFPHNVVFDEDEVPAGVDAGKISMSEEDLLNGPGEEYSVTLVEKGTYSFYCAPHQGAGMVGKVTVN